MQSNNEGGGGLKTNKQTPHKIEIKYARASAMRRCHHPSISARGRGHGAVGGRGAHTRATLERSWRAAQLAHIWAAGRAATAVTVGVAQSPAVGAFDSHAPAKASARALPWPGGADLAWR